MKKINSSFASNGHRPGLAGLSGTNPGDRLLRLQDPYMRGSDVAFVQRTVGVTEDGIFGPQTLAGVGEYQRQNGLPYNGGVVDDATWDALKSASGDTVNILPNSVTRSLKNYLDSVEGKTDWLWKPDRQIDPGEPAKEAGITTAQLVKYTAIGAVGVSLLGVTLAAMGDDK